MADQYIFTLVHGTWRRDAKWTHNDSEFCTAIRSAFGGNVQFERFLWSGKNRQKHRMYYSVQLKRFLQSTVRKHPNATHFCIGHSHGGNLIAYALSDRRISEAISGAICLSTPFIKFRQRVREVDTENKEAEISICVVFALLPMCCLKLAYHLSSVQMWCIAPMFTTVTYFLNFIIKRHVLPQHAQAREQQACKLVRRIPAIDALGKRRLAIRLPSDEAAIGLSLGSLISAIVTYIHGKLQRWSEIDEKVDKSRNLLEANNVPSLYYLLWKLLALTLRGVFTVILVVFSWLITSSVGVDIAFLSLYLDLVVDSVPPPDWDVSTLLPPVLTTTRKRWGVHSSYDHPDVVRIIREWILQASIQKTDDHKDKKLSMSTEAA